MKKIKGRVKKAEWRNYSPVNQAGDLRVEIEDENEIYSFRLPALIPIKAGDRVEVEYDDKGNVKKLEIKDKNFTYVNKCFE